jgi:hypothetical protein
MGFMILHLLSTNKSNGIFGLQSWCLPMVVFDYPHVPRYSTLPSWIGFVNHVTCDGARLGQSQEQKQTNERQVRYILEHNYVRVRRTDVEY